MIRIVFVLFMLTLSLKLGSQQVVGMPKELLKKLMADLYPDFVMDDSAKNNAYKYLKYEDRVNGQTLLVFLSESDSCTSTKLISDYSNLPAVKSELGAKYKSDGIERWTFTINGVEYLIRLKHEQWFFSVITCKSADLIK